MATGSGQGGGGQASADLERLSDLVSDLGGLFVRFGEVAREAVGGISSALQGLSQLFGAFGSTASKAFAALASAANVAIRAVEGVGVVADVLSQLGQMAKVAEAAITGVAESLVEVVAAAGAALVALGPIAIAFILIAAVVVALVVAIKKAADVFSALGGVAIAAAKGIFGVFDAMTRLGQVSHASALQGLADLFRNVSQVAVATTKAVGDLAKSLGDLARMFGPIGTAFALIAAGFEKIMGYLGKFIGYLGELPGRAAAALGAVSSYVALLDPGLVMRFDLEVKNLGAAIGLALRPVVEAILPLIERMNVWITALAGKMAGPLSRIMDAVVANMGRLWDALRRVGSAFGYLFEAWTGMTAEEGIIAAIDAMTTALVWLADQLRTVIELVETLSALWKGGANAAVRKWDEIRERREKPETPGQPGGKTFAAGESRIQGIDEASKRLQQAALSAGHKSPAEKTAEETSKNTAKAAEAVEKSNEILKDIKNGLGGGQGQRPDSPQPKFIRGY